MLTDDLLTLTSLYPSNPMFLFFPVLRRGSKSGHHITNALCVSILPRLATGIRSSASFFQSCLFLFFPVLRRGSLLRNILRIFRMFLFFPVLRRGSWCSTLRPYSDVSILPRLATGINVTPLQSIYSVFLFFPVLRRGSKRDITIILSSVSILPRLATGIVVKS